MNKEITTFFSFLEEVSETSSDLNTQDTYLNLSDVCIRDVIEISISEQNLNKSFNITSSKFVKLDGQQIGLVYSIFKKDNFSYNLSKLRESTILSLSSKTHSIFNKNMWEEYAKEEINAYQKQNIKKSTPLNWKHKLFSLTNNNNYNQSISWFHPLSKPNLSNKTLFSDSEIYLTSLNFFDIKEKISPNFKSKVLSRRIKIKIEAPDHLKISYNELYKKMIFMCQQVIETEVHILTSIQFVTSEPNSKLEGLFINLKNNHTDSAFIALKKFLINSPGTLNFILKDTRPTLYLNFMAFCIDFQEEHFLAPQFTSFIKKHEKAIIKNNKRKAVTLSNSLTLKSNTSSESSLSNTPSISESQYASSLEESFLNSDTSNINIKKNKTTEKSNLASFKKYVIIAITYTKNFFTLIINLIFNSKYTF